MHKQHSPGFLKLVQSVLPRIKLISIADVKKKIDRGEKFILIDVREDHEWDEAHLPGAQHLGKGIIERDVETRYPDMHAEMVLYCGGGYRSALATDNLQKMGYTNVWSMEGGWRGWTEAQMPIAKDRVGER